MVTGSDPLVSATWLKQAIQDPELKILDATWVAPFLDLPETGHSRFMAQHIPGAQFFDIDTICDPETSLSHMLPTPDQFSRQVEQLGVSSGDRVVIYDSQSFFASARAWWMFRGMGFEAVQVLDGGWSAWRAIGGEQDNRVQSPVKGTFEATFRPELVRDMAAMRAHISAGDTAILDARPPARFAGTAPEPRPQLPSGHMPGSVCVPGGTLIEADGRMKSADALRPLLGDYLDMPVVTSCGSGVSAAVIALALARLGQHGAALYDGSWSEWAAHPNNPIMVT